MSRPNPENASACVYCEIGGLPVEVVAEDLGATGLFARTTTPARLDSEVEIFLRSSAGAVTLRGHVVQVIDVPRAAVEHRAPGFGVLFSHVSAQARAWIDATRVASPRPSPARATPKPELPEQHTPAPVKAVSHATPTPGAVASPTPAPARPPRVDPRVAATLAVLEQELDSARGKAPWLLLGIDKDASPDAARNAFLDASRRYHPHRFARYDSDEITRAATELFVVHKRAYASLVPESGRPKRPDSGPLDVSDAGSERSPDEVTCPVDPKPREALRETGAGRDHGGPTRRLRR